MEPEQTVLARFCNTDGEPIGPQLSLPFDISTEQLTTLLNQHILKNDEPMPYSFFLNEEEILETLAATLKAVQKDKLNTEEILTIVYQPQAVFRVRSITYCSSSLPGHTEAILSVNFSPDGQRLATGSGDTTIRLWDVNTETPYHELRGHRNWVLCVKWSPNNQKLASGAMDRTVKVWDPETGECVATLAGHREAITAIDWEPAHVDPSSRRLISVSKDGTARVWDTVMKQCLFTLSGHTGSITCVRWGGEGLIYTGSQDRTIKVWNATEGKLVRTLTGHGHWINTMALNTDYALRTGAFDHTGTVIEDPEEMKKKALERYIAVKGAGCEKLATGSDDFTIFLWEASTGKKPIERLTGHGKLINVVSFSPDGRLLATASFDKNIKLWTSSGKFLTTFRGHVGEVYQLCWSADSRMIVSGSKDSTMKVWDVRTRKLKEDLPGHADEVYSVDWSPDGERVGSGSKDRLLKIWRAS